ncbi:MAG TPA: prepilin-type N-terminal cleavage/methylation domain-containing protein [Rhizomicrobium sp.]|nr:prepilin-type N-terminal cleavage/methylation domain-containing protein [Rhizomicrobium sp.]
MTALRHHNRSRAAESGFTLLELLIATTVLAFLSLLLFSGLRFGTRVWEKTETATTATNRVRAAQLVLTEEIRQIYPFFAGDAAALKSVDFAGETQRMTFFAPSKTLLGGLDLITIQAVPEQGGVSLVVASKPELEGARGVVTNYTLIRGLKWFQISYYGPPSPATASSTQASAAKRMVGANAAESASGPAQWTSVWKGQKKLPLLVRIRAAMVDKSDWPDLVVSPRIDVDESCVLDQLTKYCQGR